MKANIRLNAPGKMPVTVTLHTNIETLDRVNDALQSGDYHASLYPLKMALGAAVKKATADWTSEVSEGEDTTP